MLLPPLSKRLAAGLRPHYGYRLRRQQPALAMDQLRGLDQRATNAGLLSL